MKKFGNQNNIIKKLFISIVRILWKIFFLKTKIFFLRFFGAQIGKNCKILTSLKNIDLFFLRYLKIGDNVTVAKNVLIFTHDGAASKMLKFGIKKEQFKEVSIEDNVFVGAGAIILPGATIGKNAIIGAGSLVNKSIPTNTVAAGNPVKIIKEF